MAASYRRATGDDYDQLIDEVAAVCADADAAAVASLYARDELGVPSAVIGG